MEITIGDKYKITSDKLNYILSEKKVSDPTHRFASGDGVAKVSWNEIAYFRTFEHLTDFLVEREVKGVNVTEINEIKEKINTLKELLTVSIHDSL